MEGIPEWLLTTEGMQFATEDKKDEESVQSDTFKYTYASTIQFAGYLVMSSIHREFVRIISEHNKEFKQDVSGSKELIKTFPTALDAWLKCTHAIFDLERRYRKIIKAMEVFASSTITMSRYRKFVEMVDKDIGESCLPMIFGLLQDTLKGTRVFQHPTLPFIFGYSGFVGLPVSIIVHDMDESDELANSSISFSYTVVRQHEAPIKVGLDGRDPKEALRIFMDLGKLIEEDTKRSKSTVGVDEYRQRYSDTIEDMKKWVNKNKKVTESREYSDIYNFVRSLTGVALQATICLHSCMDELFKTITPLREQYYALKTNTKNAKLEKGKIISSVFTLTYPLRSAEFDEIKRGLSQPGFGSVLELAAGLINDLNKCFNPLCTKVDTDNSFECCGYCRVAIYCSRACQKADYKSRHKALCEEQRGKRLEHEVDFLV